MPSWPSGRRPGAPSLRGQPHHPAPAPAAGQPWLCGCRRWRHCTHRLLLQEAVGADSATCLHHRLGASARSRSRSRRCCCHLDCPQVLTARAWGGMFTARPTARRHAAGCHAPARVKAMPATAANGLRHPGVGCSALPAPGAAMAAQLYGQRPRHAAVCAMCVARGPQPPVSHRCCTLSSRWQRQGHRGIASLATDRDADGGDRDCGLRSLSCGAVAQGFTTCAGEPPSRPV